MSFRPCEEIRLLLSDAVAGELARAESASLTSHLGACGPCRRHAEALLWQDRVLTELGVQARLDELVARIRERIDRDAPLDVTAEGRVRPRRAWLPWAVAAAACVAVVLGGLLLLPNPDDPSRAVVENPPAPRSGPVPVRDPNRFLPAPDPAPAPKPETAPVLPDPPVKPTLVRKPDVKPQPAPPRKPEEVVRKTPEPVPAPKSAPVSARAKKERPGHKIIDVPRRLSVDEAIARGVKFLHGRVDAIVTRAKTADRKLVENELVLWTLLHGGFPESHPTFQKLFREMMSRRLERTYRVALQAMILEELDRVKYQPRIAQCAQFLVDNQCRDGQWSYGDPSIFADQELLAPLATATRGRKKTGVVRIRGPRKRGAKPRVVRFVQINKKREGRGGGDNSNSMYAALGLRACHDAGFLLPKQVVDRAQKWWREAQEAKGKNDAGRGWCYGGKNHAAHPAYGSMTAGAVGSLAIYDFIQKREWKQDRAVQDGMTWLAKNFSVTANPGTPEHGGGKPDYMYFYYMYGLERAGMLYGTGKMGDHDWYKEGERALLAVQRLDGSWQGGSVRDTCFAILFLKRATAVLPSVSTGGGRK